MRANEQKFPISEVMSYAVAVQQYQGFVASGNGWYDHEVEQHRYHNKTLILHMLEGGTDIQTPEVTDEHRDMGNHVIEHFRTSLAFKKLGDTLNNFEERVAEFIGGDLVGRFGVSVAASLPNSYRIDEKREQFKEQMDVYRYTSQFQGNIGAKLSMDVAIIDMKFLRNFGNYVVTGVTDDKHIIKFFWNKDPDLTGVLEGKTLKLIGRVKNHELSKYTNCNETMLNYVKILEIKG